MTGPQHYKAAEGLAAQAANYEGLPSGHHVQLARLAQVHATLAQAEAGVAGLITALRDRAGALDSEAADPATPARIDEHGVAKDPAALRWLAAEFRALADNSRWP